MSVKYSISQPKGNTLSKNKIDLYTKIRKDDILSHFILTVQGFIRQNKRIWISHDIQDLILFLYAKPVIINIIYDDKEKYILYCPVNEEPIFIVKLNLILNKTTYFDRNIAQQTYDIFDQYAQSKEQMEIMTKLILQSAIKFNEYVKLCGYLYTRLSKMILLSNYEWVMNEPDISKTFRRIIIEQTNELFEEYCINFNSGSDETDDYIGVVTLIAQLYLVELINKKVLFIGVFKRLLPSKNKHLAEIDCKGLCLLLKLCGKKLDKEAKKSVDKYLQILKCHAKKSNYIIEEMVEETILMRANRWIWNKSKQHKERLLRKKNRQFWWRDR